MNFIKIYFYHTWSGNSSYYRMLIATKTFDQTWQKTHLSKELILHWPKLPSPTIFHCYSPKPQCTTMSDSWPTGLEPAWKVWPIQSHFLCWVSFKFSYFDCHINHLSKSISLLWKELCPFSSVQQAETAKSELFISLWINWIVFVISELADGFSPWQSAIFSDRGNIVSLTVYWALQFSFHEQVDHWCTSRKWGGKSVSINDFRKKELSYASPFT